MSGPYWERNALNSATIGAAQASEADTIMRDHDDSSEGGNFGEEDPEFSEDGGGFAEVGAELIPKHHQFAPDDASVEDGSWFQSDHGQSSEDYFYMEDDEKEDDWHGDWDVGNLPGAPWHCWQTCWRSLVRFIG